MTTPNTAQNDSDEIVVLGHGISDDSFIQDVITTCVQNMLFEDTKKGKFTDIFIQAGAQIQGKYPLFLAPLHNKIVTEDDVTNFLQAIKAPTTVEEIYDTFKRHGECVRSAQLGEHYLRFSIALTKGMQNKRAIVIRIIEPLTDAQSLKIPLAMMKVPKMKSGLVIITGHQGQGKTTTSGWIIQEINATRPAHIVLIERPLERLFEPQQSIITEIQIPENAVSEADAVEQIMRQRVDVVVIGEVRNKNTLDAGLMIAPSGLLALLNIHMARPTDIIKRIKTMYDSNEVERALQLISSNLAIICGQLLLPTKDGRKQVMACEIIMPTAAVKKAIAEGDEKGLLQAVRDGKDQGCVSLETAVQNLFSQNLISENTARPYLVSP
jgi:twitching motility protein PilT